VDEGAARVRVYSILGGILPIDPAVAGLPSLKFSERGPGGESKTGDSNHRFND